jgi:hypothetical protein
MDYVNGDVVTNNNGEKVLFREPDEAWLLTRVEDNFPIGVVRDSRHAVNLIMHHYAYAGEIKEVRVTPHRNIIDGEVIYFSDGTQKFGKRQRIEEWVDIHAVTSKAGGVTFMLRKIASLL